MRMPDDRTGGNASQPALWKSQADLARLAEGGAAVGPSPQLATALARALIRAGGGPKPLLRPAQAQHPDHFWLNYELGLALNNAKRWEEAVGFHRAALALRPRSAAVHNNLGIALRERGRAKKAEAVRKKWAGSRCGAPAG